MDQRSRAANRASQRRHRSAINARPRLVFVVCRTPRLARGCDEPRMAFEEESKVPEKIDARVAKRAESWRSKGFVRAATRVISDLSICRKPSSSTISGGAEINALPRVASFRRNEYFGLQTSGGDVGLREWRP